MEFKAGNPSATVDARIYESFIATNGQRIDAERRARWPDLTKAQHLKHWSGLDLASRVKLPKSPFDEIYSVNYPQLSWYVHSGLTGIINLQAETFTLMCGIAFKLSADSYRVTKDYNSRVQNRESHREDRGETDSRENASVHEKPAAGATTDEGAIAVGMLSAPGGEPTFAVLERRAGRHVGKAGDQECKDPADGGEMRVL